MNRTLVATLGSVAFLVSSARAQVHPQWVRTYDASPYSNDTPLSTAVAPTGEVCVGGMTGTRMFVVVFRAEGQRAWSHELSGTYLASANGVLFDDAKNVYVVGRTDIATGTAARALKYDRAGGLVWDSSFHTGAGSTQFLGARLSPTGNLVAHGLVNEGVVVVEYDPQGHVLWNTTVPGGDYLADLAFGPSGEIVVVGSFDEINDGSKFGVAKLSSSGALLWAQRFTGGGADYQAGHAVLVGADGSIYAGGRIQEPGTGPSGALYKLDPDGNMIWVRTHRGTGSGGTIYSEGLGQLAFAPNGNVRTAGQTLDAGTGADVHVAEFTPDGNLAWQADWDGPAHDDDVPTALATGDDGSVTALAVSERTSGVYDPAVLRFGPHGDLRWADVEPVSAPVASVTGADAIGAGGQDVFAGQTLVDGRLGSTGLAIVSERDQARPYCFGYGAGAACPCGNTPPRGEGEGCVNSTGAAARMTDAGRASLSGDTLALTVTGAVGGSPVVFVQGDLAVAPATFGDGLRCVGPTAKPLYVHRANGGVAVAPEAGELSFSARSAALGDPIPTGGVRFYQAIYRDGSAVFCAPPAGGSLNASSALGIEWAQ